jgi:hypothetical protein
LRCGLHAAAAVRNAGMAAALLDKILSDERLLRAFASFVSGESGTMWLDERKYPWSLIASEPAVVAARQRLDQAYAHEREIARTALAGLP